MLQSCEYCRVDARRERISYEDEMDDSNALYIFSSTEGAIELYTRYVWFLSRQSYKMENDYKIYCIDAFERNWIVDGDRKSTV